MPVWVGEDEGTEVSLGDLTREGHYRRARSLCVCVQDDAVANTWNRLSKECYFVAPYLRWCNDVPPLHGSVPLIHCPQESSRPEHGVKDVPVDSIVQSCCL